VFFPDYWQLATGNWQLTTMDGVDAMAQEQRSPLQTSRGNTTIAENVVSKVVGMVVQEVEGVSLGVGASRAIGGFMETVTGANSAGPTRGVSVEVGETETAIDLTMGVTYGTPIPQVAEAVRKAIVSQVEGLLGLRVAEVNITVTQVIFPDGEQEAIRSGRRQVR